MKVRIEYKEIETVYPTLKVFREDKDFVVLFTEKGVGTVVSVGNSIWELGQHADEWGMDAFVDFKGAVTLSN